MMSRTRSDSVLLRNHSKVLLFVLLAVALGGALPAAAQPAPSTVPAAVPTVAPASAETSATDGNPTTSSIDDVLAALRERSPLLAAERARIDVARADIAQARILPNPVLSYGVSGLTSGTPTSGGSAHAVTLGVPLLIAGQRGTRTDAAELSVRAAEQTFRVRFNALALDVRRAYYALALAEAREAQLVDAEADLARVAVVVRGRASSGDRSRYDALRIGVEQNALEARRLAAHADAEAARGALAVTMAIADFAPHTDRSFDVTAELPADVSFEALWARAESRLVPLVSARADLLAAQGAERAAYRERWPVPVVSIGTNLTTAPFGAYLYGGLSVPLPLFDQNQGGIARAQAEAHRAVLAEDALRATARTDLERALRVYRQQRAALDHFDRDVLPELAPMRAMAEQAYQAGALEILGLLDAMRSARDLERQRLDHVAAVKLAEQELLHAAGLIDVP